MKGKRVKSRRSPLPQSKHPLQFYVPPSFVPSNDFERRLSSHQRHSKLLLAGLCARSLPIPSYYLSGFPKRIMMTRTFKIWLARFLAIALFTANLGVVAR